MQETFTVPAHRMETLTARLNKLVNKANKYGNEPIGYTIGEKHIVEKVITNNFHRREKIQIEMVDIIVWGNAPKYGEYTFAAKVEFMDGGENVVHNIANIELENRFRFMVNHCDHCGHNRVRNNVYVFTNANGEQMAVGSSCLKDFTGCENPLEIANRATFANDVADICGDEEKEYFGSFGESQYTAQSLLQCAAANIRVNGWIAKANANYELGIMSTADRVHKDMLGKNIHWTPVEICEADIALADETLQYFRNADYFGNDYLNNIRVILKSDIVKHHHMGLVVSAVNVILKEKSQRIIADTNVSQFVGNVRDRLRNISVIFEREIFVGSTMYGDKFIYQFNYNGNTLVWFTDKKELTIGNTYTMDASVKEHKEYRGVKQTVITRATIG